MVNQPGKPADPGRFPAPKEGGEEVRNYEALLDQYGARKFAEGEVMKGTVLKITSTDVIVDIGYKSEGVIPVSQFIDSTGQLAVAIGDVIDVLLEDTEDYDGHIVLSKEKAEKVRIWEDVERAHNEGLIIRGRVIERIKGGLEGRHRRSRISAGIADRRPACEESRFAQGQGNRMPRHQVEPQAGQHRAVAQERPRERAGPQEGLHA